MRNIHCLSQPSCDYYLNLIIRLIVIIFIPVFSIVILAVVIVTVVLAMLVAMTLGPLAAYKAGSWFDRAVSVLSLAAASTPDFWLAILLIIAGLFFQVMARFLLPLFMAVLLVVIFAPVHRWWMPTRKEPSTWMLKAEKVS